MAEVNEARTLESRIDEFLLLGDDSVTRDLAIAAMLRTLAEHGLIEEVLVPDIHAAILRRDELGPTGVGEGVAIPHAWHAGLTRMVVALAVSTKGIDYPSIDRQPVHIVLLVLSPPRKENEAAKQAVFETGLRHLREPAVRARLIAARTPREVRDAVRLADSTSFRG